jgi:site-specific recombinase XerD
MVRGAVGFRSTAPGAVHRLDFHQYQQQFSRTTTFVRQSNISTRNQQLILGYVRACQLHNLCGLPRLVRAMFTLVQHARIIRKDFDRAKRKDLERYVHAILHYRPSTVATHKAIVRRFYTWLHHPRQFPNAKPPALVAWITGRLRQADAPRVAHHELLTHAEVQRMINAATTIRDRALVSLLWESGARIGELGSLRKEDVSARTFGHTLSLNGKTGSRQILVVASAPALSFWLECHPSLDSQSPLWMQLEGTEPLGYSGILAMLERVARRAGVKKRVYPHLFRHSRVTYVLATGLMNEAQAKRYFGWTPGSDMLATYSHLIDEDANHAILRENRIGPE